MTAELLDIAWILVASGLVLLMQAGFTALESGLVRTKNSINVASKNFADFCVAAAIFWSFGFALMFGVGGGGLLGSSEFLFDTDEPWLMAFFLFQLGFVGAAVTITSGAVAERMHFVGYLIVAAIVGALIYPVFGHWAWGSAAGLASDGWLEGIGFVDFAGSTVVHSVGGWIALAAILILGPRIGRFGVGSVPIRGHDLPMTTVGVFLLWVGWFGFNGGSTLALTDEVPGIIVNTTISAAFGGLAALGLSWAWFGRPDIATIMNGALAGLVGITASANIMDTWAAVVIGLVAGGVMVGATALLERFEIDDAVGAVPVHLAAGIWGTLAVALLADSGSWGTGNGRLEQLGAQLAGIGACFAWAFGLGFALLWLVNRWVPFRIDEEGERIGLNVSEHGASTEILDLLTEMDDQRAQGDFSRPVSVEPHTEVGQIARQYNRVLDAINTESSRREAAAAALRQQTESLRLMQRTASAANEAVTVEEAIRICVDEVCAYTGWSIGHAYLLDEEGSGELVPSDIWHLTDPDRFDELRGVTLGIRFPPGRGLPGRVLTSHAPEWFKVADADPSFGRKAAAERAGLKSGFAFPVLAGREVAAVLEFYSTEDIEPDEELLELMGSIGTQLGRAVERTRSEEQRFQTVVDRMPALVHLRDLAGRLILVNRPYEEFFGIRNEFARGKTLEQIEQERGVDMQSVDNAEHDRQVLVEKRAIEREFTVRRGGKAYTFADVKFPIDDLSGQTVAVGGIDLDISERKEHEAELAELLRTVEMARDQAMQATAAKSRFLASMSHELRTPMNAIMGFSRLVRRRSAGLLPRRELDNLDKILGSAAHLMSLINDILDLSRIEAGRQEVFPREVDVAHLVDHCLATIEPLLRTEAVELRNEVNPDLPLVYTDGEKLTQILLNLVGNGVKFTKEGSVTVRASAAEETVEIDVVDTGIGVSQSKLEHIFEEFSQVDGGATREYGGTGLGLTISRRLARLLGGDISVESTLGRGSVFTVMLPLRYVVTEPVPS